MATSVYYSNSWNTFRCVQCIYNGSDRIRKGIIPESLNFFFFGVRMVRMQSIVGIQGYIFHQIYAEQGKDHNDHWDEILSQLSAAGVEGYEQGLLTEDHARRLGK